MAENRAHSVAGWRAESSCGGVDLTDAPRRQQGLDSPESASLRSLSSAGGPTCLRLDSDGGFLPSKQRKQCFSTAKIKQKKTQREGLR